MARTLHALLYICVGGLIAFGAIWAQNTYARSVNGPVSTPEFHYQGRLIDPNTGTPRVDGSYPMQFGLYTEAVAGVPIWTETKNVQVLDGIFSTMLGDTTPLNPTDINGQDLWLGITVGTDPQMEPRQPLAHVPYALHANNASNLGGQPASAYAPNSTSPIAFGYVRYDGVPRNGSHGIESVTWNSTYNRYEISITDEYYSISNVTVANIAGDAGNCPAGAVVRVSSVSGQLLVYIVQADGTNRQCSFHFVSYGPQL